MNSRVTEDFVARFAKLPKEVQAQTRKNYRLRRANQSHPGLHFKRIHSQEPLYSVRVGRGWRAVGLLESDTINWFWIGSYSKYDKLLNEL